MVLRHQLGVKRNNDLDKIEANTLATSGNKTLHQLWGERIREREKETCKATTIIVMMMKGQS